MSRLTLALLAATCLTVAAAACKKKQPQQEQDEDLKAVVADDRRIAKQEGELLARRGGLQRERNTLRDKRAELITKKLILPETDAQGREALEKEESKIAGLEAQLAKQEVRINDKLQSILDERLDKLSKDQSGAAKEVLVVRREHAVALREKDFARREGDLASREKLFATREQALAERQAKLCPGRVTTVVAAAPPVGGGGGGGGGSFGRKDVEPIYKAALAAMQSKGILTADLPAGVDRLVTEVRHSVAKGDYTRAKYAADQLAATVRGMKVDRDFIGAKIGRLNAAVRASPLAGDRRAKVTTLFQQATAAYGDGRFIEANKLLNRIYSALH